MWQQTQHWGFLFMDIYGRMLTSKPHRLEFACFYLLGYKISQEVAAIATCGGLFLILQDKHARHITLHHL